MPDFRYRAIDRSGREVSGRLRASTRRQVVKRLRDRGMFPFEIQPYASILNSTLQSLPIRRNPVDSQQLVIFPRQLSVLLGSGVPLLRSLRILENQTADTAFQRILRDVAGNVEEGARFSDALGGHPEVFGEMFVRMVRAGEAGGVLDQIMDRLAQFEERRHELRSRIRSATLYPAAVSLFAAGIVVFLLTWVLPTFESLFQSLDVPLPLPTRIVLGAGRFIHNGWVWLGTGFILTILILIAWARTEAGQDRIDQLKLELPLFGRLFRVVLTARFTRTLGTLLQSGLPILQALDIVHRTVGNRVLSRSMNRVRASVSEGKTMNKPLKETGLFQPMVTHMIAVGEETGNLDRMLIRVADMYESQAEDQIKGLTSMLEPLLIIVLGLVVGFIVMAMFFPMFHLVSAVG